MRPLLGLLLLAWPLLLHAEVSVIDGSGRPVQLAQPARRIVSLAPHVTELLYAAGAGAQLVGAVEYSDYPQEARAVARVGSYEALDIERILALRPDLVVGWNSGNITSQLAQLERLGLTLYRDAPQRMADIPHAIEQLGRLAGSGAVAQAVVADWRARLQRLRERHAAAPTLGVFYQVWNRPLMTVNGAHLISDAIRLCGGENVFAGLPALVPQLSVEAVLAADPQVIVASGMADERPEWLDDWRHWPRLRAVQRDHLYFVPPDLLQRAGPRFIEGAERLCAQLEQARSR